MPYRSPVLATGEIYHAFNRSNGNEEIFTQKRNLQRALDLIDYYRFPQKIKYSQFLFLSNEAREKYLIEYRKEPLLVEIFSFALMPDHYHLLLRQVKNGGTVKFISNFQNSFAKYFNLKNERHGALFQNAFKAKRVETDEEFLHISRYIHLNPVTSFIIEFSQLLSYPWTSFGWYLNERLNKFINRDWIFEVFHSNSKEKYKKFVADQVDYQKKLGLIKRLTFE